MLLLLVFSAFCAPAMESTLWAIAVKSDNDTGQLKNTVSEYANCTPFKVPAQGLRVGTLDSLMSLSDDLGKMDLLAEATVAKMYKQLLELRPDDGEPHISGGTHPDCACCLPPPRRKSLPAVTQGPMAARPLLWMARRRGSRSRRRAGPCRPASGAPGAGSLPALAYGARRRALPLGSARVSILLSIGGALLPRAPPPPPVLCLTPAPSPVLLFSACVCVCVCAPLYRMDRPHPALLLLLLSAAAAAAAPLAAGAVAAAAFRRLRPPPSAFRRSCCRLPPQCRSCLTRRCSGSGTRPNFSSRRRCAS